MSAGWSLGFSEKAERDLANLNSPVRSRVVDKLEWLEKNFDSVIPLVLTGEFRNFYKLRIGDLRVIYNIDWQTHHIIIHLIDRRDKIYKTK